MNKTVNVPQRQFLQQVKFLQQSKNLKVATMQDWFIPELKIVITLTTFSYAFVLKDAFMVMVT